MRHLRTPGQPHLLSRVNISRLHQIAGISQPVLESPHLRLPHLEGSWLTHFRESLTTIRSSIQIASLRLIPLQHSHDIYIMDYVLSSLQFSDQDIQFINYCRFYVQATSISDICTAAGTHLQPGIHNCTLPSISISKLSKPYQELPGPLAWRTWRRFLRLISEPNGTLFCPLGPWLHNAQSLCRFWPFVYSPSQQLLYQWQATSYLPLHPTRFHLFNSISPDLTMLLPEDSLPIDAFHTLDGWRITLPTSLCPPIAPPFAFPTFPEYLESLPDHSATTFWDPLLMISPTLSPTSTTSSCFPTVVQEMTTAATDGFSATKTLLI
jgi:hypothetical protein